jgi:hypothetical protein
MADTDNAAAKARMLTIFGIGLAALIASYTIATDSPVVQGIFLVVVAVCFVTAGMMARKLRKPAAAK